MRMHVEQLEKDKRELAERMRVIGKWLDHVERAYRKEERPLLAKDYESQQENDRLIFETLQTSRVESSKRQHQLNLESKTRLSRMLVDFKGTKGEIQERRCKEHSEKQKEASGKFREEKAKRIAAARKEREEERLRREAEEQQLREREEEARQEAGQFPYLPLCSTRIMTFHSRAPCGRGTGAPRERSRGSRSRGSQEEGRRREA